MKDTYLDFDRKYRTERLIRACPKCGELLREFMLQPGSLHLALIAVYLPAGEHAQESPALGGVARGLLQSQMDFDVLGDEAILAASLDGGSLSLEGVGYRAIVLPGVTAIPLSTYGKLADFVATGGSLVSCGPLPTKALGDGTDAQIQGLSEALAREVRVEVAAEAAQAPEVLTYFVPRDVTLSEPCADLLCEHRLEDEQHLYLLANCGEAALVRRATLATVGAPALRLPGTGDARPLEHERTEEGTAFDLRLESGEGVCVVFAPGAQWLAEAQDSPGACCFERTGVCGRCHETDPEVGEAQ